MIKKIVIVTGGFDPIHSGHIAYIKAAKALGDMLIVGLNSDAWLTRKKGKPFMKWNERAAILRELRDVDDVYSFNDDDGTAIDCIQFVNRYYPNNKIIFANGGDRTALNIPEMNCGIDGVEFVFGVGGKDKLNSSSRILKEWENENVY